MAITSGFYNSPNATDRRLYSAQQMGEMFDGIITDGVFPNVGTAFNISPVSGNLAIKVGSGRAWFKNTWTYNDAEITINLDTAHATYPRYDLLVLKIDKTPSVAKNTIEIIKGTSASPAQVPTVTNTGTVFYYILAELYIPAGITDGTKITLTKYIGTDSVPYVKPITSIENISAEQHNLIYRGMNLGSTMTSAQLAAIRNGTFKDLYIGDYWRKGDTYFTIAGFDYWHGKGDTPLTNHHIVVVVDITGQATSTSKREWTGESVLTSGKGYGISTIKYECSDYAARFSSMTMFAPETLLSRRDYFHNSASNEGKHMDGAWATTKVDILNEIMLFGCYINTEFNTPLTQNGNRLTANNSQLPLFRIAPKHIISRSGQAYWLRDLAKNNYACCVDQYGLASVAVTQNELLPRYVFAIG